MSPIKLKMSLSHPSKLPTQTIRGFSYPKILYGILSVWTFRESGICQPFGSKWSLQKEKLYLNSSFFVSIFLRATSNSTRKCFKIWFRVLYPSKRGMSIMKGLNWPTCFKHPFIRIICFLPTPNHFFSFSLCFLLIPLHLRLYAIYHQFFLKFSIE